ncbi:MAG: hypothetical protein V4637_09425 [Pseudomonadota bacterium]
MNVCHPLSVLPLMRSNRLRTLAINSANGPNDVTWIALWETKILIPTFAASPRIATHAQPG